MKPLFISFAVIFLACTSCHRTSPEQRVHDMMTDRMTTLATAESCTGGTIASRFTALPGASAYFKYGIVAYSNDAKQKILNISCDTIARYGVVSEMVVRKMAEHARQLAAADYAIATTGIAGPTGGTAEHPVGTVWIAVATPAHTTTALIHAEGDRSSIIRQAGNLAIELLEKELQMD